MIKLSAEVEYGSQVSLDAAEAATLRWLNDLMEDVPWWNAYSNEKFRNATAIRIVHDVRELSRQKVN